MKVLERFLALALVAALPACSTGLRAEPVVTHFGLIPQGRAVAGSPTAFVIVALDASTGKEAWVYAPDPVAGIITNRGINYWESKDRADRRLVPNTISLVAAGAVQREGFERRQLTVGPHHVVIRDLDCGGTAGI